MPLLLKSNNAETGTNGSAVTTANSGGSTANNFHSITGTWTYANSPVLQSGLCYSTTGGVSALRWQSVGPITKWKVSCWWQTPSIAVTSDIIKVTYDLAGTTWAKFEFSNSANRFRVKNNAATLGTSTIIPAINTTYRFDFIGDNAAGTIQAIMYNSVGTQLDSVTYTAVACPQMVYIDFGPNVASGTAAFFDGIEVYDNGTQTYTAPTTGNSLRVSVDANGTSYPKIDSAPATSILIGMWTKPYVVTASPLKSGNHEIICFGGRFWEMQQITDNISGNVHTDGNIDSFNQNSQFFASKTSGGTLNWANDYTVFYNPSLITETVYRDWKYSMWQVVNDTGNSQFIIRQWIKWGKTGSVQKTGESTVTYAAIRTSLQSNAGWTAPETAAWVPDNMDHIYLGDSGAGGTIWDYIRNVKVFNRSTEPSLSEIETIATTYTADATAWLDCELKWTSGFPILTDRSGNGRTMYDAGTIRQGEEFFNATAVVSTTSTGSPMMSYGRAVPLQVRQMMARMREAQARRS